MGGAMVARDFRADGSVSQMYMDISTIDQIGGEAGRPAFHQFLAEAIGRGLGKRIMFGSDEMGWPDAIGLAIKGVDSAPFLSPEQKTDIFYENAMTFFQVVLPRSSK
jgi:predicted TIM-barrel fold metal-dependent hydrolase